MSNIKARNALAFWHEVDSRLIAGGNRVAVIGEVQTLCRTHDPESAVFAIVARRMTSKH